MLEIILAHCGLLKLLRIAVINLKMLSKYAYYSVIEDVLKCPLILY
jgi:hypothetical protein